jgi:inorganic pyrophosphatase
MSNSVSYGDNAPDVVNVVIEIQRGSRNKYEHDEKTGRIFLDRVNGTLLGYPSDYGEIPNTLCEDGDPLDALVICDESLLLDVVVPCRPVGVLYFEDDGEKDEKLICVPANDISKEHIQHVDDLGEAFKKNVEHFYKHYKDWKNNWKGVPAVLNGWGGPDEAIKIVQESIERAKK